MHLHPFVSTDLPGVALDGVEPVVERHGASGAAVAQFESLDVLAPRVFIAPDLFRSVAAREERSDAAVAVALQMPAVALEHSP